MSVEQTQRYLVTGACGCIGTWVLRELLAAGAYVVAFDVSDDAGRMRLVIGEQDLARVVWLRGNVAELAALEHALDEHMITRVIHLAALQVPFCRADPPHGALVNVVGTTNVFEAVADRQDRIGPVVYASSVAAYDAIDDRHAESQRGTMVATPSTMYGVYKRANEAGAGVYASERGLASVGLRPHTVYGVGRDQGLTAAPTFAMLAAAAGVRYHIPFGGRCQLQYAQDVARAFVQATEAPSDGAVVHDLAGPSVEFEDVIAAIERCRSDANGLITCGTRPLPFLDHVDGVSLAEHVGPVPQTPLADGVRETVERFANLLARGAIGCDAVLAGPPRGRRVR